MIGRTTAASGLAAVTVGLAILASHAPAQQKKTPLKIGMVSSLLHDLPEAKVQALLPELQNLMREQTGLEGEVIAAGDALDLGKQINDNAIQLGVFHGFEFAWARQTYPKLKPLLIAVNRQQHSLRAFVAILNENKATSLADLKGKAISIPQRCPAHCLLFLERELSAMGVEQKDFFGKIVNHASVEEARRHPARQGAGRAGGWRGAGQLRPGETRLLRPADDAEKSGGVSARRDGLSRGRDRRRDAGQVQGWHDSRQHHNPRQGADGPLEADRVRERAGGFRGAGGGDSQEVSGGEGQDGDGQMKIIKLEVEGFRSLRSLSWCPGDLNVVIGANASGKSNLLRVLEMLSVASHGGLGKLVQQEGGMGPLVWDGKVDQIMLRVNATPSEVDPFETIESVTYELRLARLGRGSEYRIDQELLGFFGPVDQATAVQPTMLIDRDGRRAKLFSETKPMLVTPVDGIPEDETLLALMGGPLVQHRFVAAFQKELSSWRIYWRIYQSFETRRDAPIRSPQVARAETQVSADGQNLISVLHSLYTGNRDFENEIDTAMKAAFGDDFEKLVFPPAADQRIQLRIRWKSMQQAQSAADLSDGTLRFLFLLAILANPSPPPLIAIDEPETGLHPAMLDIVAEYARDASSRSQVILTTHSPELLDSFGAEPPTTTVVERVDGETKLRVIAGDELHYWLKKYTLGELFRSNELEAMK